MWSYVRCVCVRAYIWRGAGRKEQVDVVSAVPISSCFVIKHAAAHTQTHTSNFLQRSQRLIVRQKVLCN